MKVVIMGAGPAGLTAGFALLALGRGRGEPVDISVLEETGEVGGISATKRYGGYRFDIGGHRFFTKNDRVRKIWHSLLGDDFLVRNRLSRIYYKNKLFHYPLRPMDMISTLSMPEVFSVAASYTAARLFPRPERSFEDWVSNNFGAKLFEIFFKKYSEKVWGMPCDAISADWAGQRIKGVSFTSVVKNAFTKGSAKGEVKSMIERFEYPRLGPGMLWEAMAARLEREGVRFLFNSKVRQVVHDGARITGVIAGEDGGQLLEADSFLSSIPLRELVEGLRPRAEGPALEASQRLRYRDFLIVALILNKTKVFDDNWIYVQMPDVAVGRIQNFKNWSPEMVPDPEMSCLGMEYFCFEGDRLWNSSDEQLVARAREELVRLGFAAAREVKDGVAIRMKKAYPVYTLDYKEDIRSIRDYLRRFPNLQIMGRNGLHRYNNQDHSMMTAMLAAENVFGAGYDVYKVNEDASYHEEK